MTTLYVTHPGQVTAINGEIGKLPMTIMLDDWPGFPAIRAIVTHVGISAGGNYQFLHTLKEYIYVYVFGERIGDVAISGLLFSEACTASAGVSSALAPVNAAEPSGIEQLCDFYNRNRIAVRGQPMRIIIGTSGFASFQAFLVGHKSEISDPQQQLGQFTLFFKNLTPEALGQ